MRRPLITLLAIAGANSIPSPQEQILENQLTGPLYNQDVENTQAGRSHLHVGLEDSPPSQVTEMTRAVRRDVFTGDLTYYTPGLGSCGHTNTDAELIVALPKTIMEPMNGSDPNSNPLCGKSITISSGGKTAVAIIVDTSGSTLDVTSTLFQQFADLSVGRISGVQWWYN